MPTQTWTLTDVAQGIHEKDFRLTPEDLSSASGSWQVTRRTLHGGLSEGVDVIEIDNGNMRLFVVPTRGMGIWRAEASDGQMLGWRSPVRGPVHPAFVPIHDPSGLGWLEGFDELVVRCGLQSNGAPEFDDNGQLIYPLHGRIANRPAHQVELEVDDEARTISLRGVVEETRFHFQKLRLEATVTTSFDSMSFQISDRVTNFGSTPAKLQMLYHINIGEPTLDQGSQFVAPVQKVSSRDAADPTGADWNDYGEPVAGGAEQCYYLKMLGDDSNQTRVLLKNSHGSAGTAVGFSTAQLPCFTLWKNSVAREDGYVTGLEPATNYPNSHSVEAEAGRVVSLEPQDTWSADFTVDWLLTSEEVAQAEAAVRGFET